VPHVPALTADPAKLPPTPSIDPNTAPTATATTADVLVGKPTVSIAKPGVSIQSAEPPPPIAEPVEIAAPVESVAAPAATTALAAKTPAPQSLAEPPASTEQLSTIQFLTPCKRSYEETILLGFSENLEADESNVREPSRRETIEHVVEGNMELRGGALYT
jgi:hypothetical protein